MSTAGTDAETAAASRWWTGVSTGAAALVAAGVVLVGASAHPGPTLVGSTHGTSAAVDGDRTRADGHRRR